MENPSVTSPIMKGLKALKTYLKTVLCIFKILLACFIRKKMEVLLHADDPSINYLSGTNKMIVKASHNHPAYAQDTTKILDILQVALE